MNQKECQSEKWSSRTIGLIILPFAVALGLLGALIVPFVGVVFAAPFLVLALFFIAAPESSVCRLILRRES